MKKFTLIHIIITIFFAISINAQIFNWATPENLNILNTENDEFAPFFDKNQKKLYFNSTFSGKSQLYWSETFDDVEFSKPILHKSKLNNPKESRSYYHFLNDGKVYFSKFRKTKKFPVLNIAFSEIFKNNYIEPIFIEQFKCDCFCSHPTLSKDGKTLVFVSNRNNNLDNLDLYISYMNDDGQWSEPIELSEINSTGNEITPFLYKDSLLFFASDGLDGIGGYDIYYSEFYDGKWQKPIPLNEINTEFNESDFILLDNNFAFFASDRPGGKGGLDLYILRPIRKDKEKEDIDLTLKFSPSEIRLQKIYQFLSVDLSIPLEFSPNFFDYSENIKIVNKEIEVELFETSILKHLFQISLLYSQLKSQNLEIFLSPDLNIEQFSNYLDQLAKRLNFPIEKISYKFDESLPSKNFKLKISEKITLHKVQIASDLKNITFEIHANQALSDKIILTADPSTKLPLFTYHANQNQRAFSIELIDLTDYLKSENELKLFIFKINKNDTNLIKSIAIPMIATISKSPIMIRKQNKFYFYYSLRLADNFEEFSRVNKSDIEMIKQNITLANSIEILYKNDNYSKIKELTNSVFGNRKINFMQIKQNDENINFDLPYHILVKIGIPY